MSTPYSDTQLETAGRDVELTFQAWQDAIAVQDMMLEHNVLVEREEDFY